MAPKKSSVAKVIGITPVAVVAPAQPEHAHLSASGSHKWLVCTPSPRLESQFADEDTEFSKEGTFGHLIFNHRLCVYLGRETAYPFENQYPGHKDYWSQELSDSVDRAYERAVERIEHARNISPDAKILLEQRLDFSHWVPEGFGTGDVVIITDHYVEVLDLKMGRGVEVSAIGNSQFRLYMLGAVSTYGHLYAATRVVGTVLQPRLNNWSSEDMDITDLLIWADTVVVPAAKLAWAGEGEFVAGEHCTTGFCKARFNCATRAAHNHAVATSDFAGLAPELMTDEQVAKVLEKADEAIKWLNDVKKFALDQAVAGRNVPGYKLVEGRSNRTITNPEELARKLVDSGVAEELLYERSMLTLTALEDALGKKAVAAAGAGLIVKPQGKPVLVPVSDKRDAITLVSTATEDFS